MDIFMEIVVYGSMFLLALVVQWIEQPRPKGLMWVRFLPRAQHTNKITCIQKKGYCVF